MTARPRWVARLLGHRPATAAVTATAGSSAGSTVDGVARVVYESGTEFDPADPFGLCVLDLRPDGTADLLNRRRGESRTYQATALPTVFDRLVDHLREAGFPDAPQHDLPAGPTRRVTLHGPATHLSTAPLAFYEAMRWPGYREAFHLLDSLVVAVSQGDLPVIQDAATDLIET
jgi:hypothetical protein